MTIKHGRFTDLIGMSGTRIYYMGVLCKRCYHVHEVTDRKRLREGKVVFMKTTLHGCKKCKCRSRKLY